MPRRAADAKRPGRPLGRSGRAASPAKQARPLVFLDRDGVLNRDPGKAYYVRTPAQFRWIPGVLVALKRLTDAGARIAVVSNQAGVGKGLVPAEALDAITQKILADAAKAGARIEGIFYCTHAPEAGCRCRKPATGLFEAAVRSMKPGRVPRFMIGDTERDLAAGQAAGCRTALVLSGKTRTAAQIRTFKTRPDTVVRNLGEAVAWVLSQKKS